MSAQASARDAGVGAAPLPGEASSLIISTETEEDQDRDVCV